MKKILFALIASATALTGVAQAADAGTAYVGAGLVGSRYKFDVPNSSSTDDRSGSKVSGKLFAGYNLDKNWAVEGGYTDFGKNTYNYTKNGVTGKIESKSNSLYLAGKYSQPINEQFAVFGKLGVARNSNKINGNKGDKTGLYASVGGEYAINKNVSLSLEYEHYGKNESDLGRKNGAITGGLRYNF
ncbi:outer membrane beta-barrel protein [Rugamonas sp. DEMB1]|uniref:outer membrane beta-barrel protein n=1 Tax=Rugamonas sp. DEMB1 TaxID=3039386 RepID=UPI00244AEA83|nr:outer membrane beta-barrel protein [Rugamonas sp. DEMB1]WGG50367.1 outer membrane beta-barrel protein [Rugamonas sp. DEMB1]